MRVLREWQTGDLGRMLGGMASITLASNVEDEAGTPIDLRTNEGWNEMPADFLDQVGQRVLEVVNPKAAAASANGSMTPSPPAEVLSPPITR